jgi:uroporphyrin-III C-methyltransferase
MRKLKAEGAVSHVSQARRPAVSAGRLSQAGVQWFEAQRRESMKGKVYLVGAGPGDPELLTVKALRILKAADIVLHDELIGPEILALAPPGAFLHNVGKRCGQKSTPQEQINSLLVTLASSGLQVVRLKGGDPLVFGRGGEEIEALRSAKIEFEIVPGVTAAVGAAAATQISLTHRRVSSALVLLTNQHCHEKAGDDWRQLVSSRATVVIYMPGYNYEATSRRLVEAGLKSDTPCTIVSRATLPEQQVYHTTVGNLPGAPQLPAPTLLVVGEVARLADAANHFEVVSGLTRQQPSVSLATHLSQEQILPDREQSA